MVSGQCLCGAHQFELSGPLQMNHHCHCEFCRKQYGSACASMVGVAPEDWSWTRGDVIAYESSPGLIRESCATCGTALPLKIEGLPDFVPAGCLDDLDTEMEFHIFVGSKAPWFEIRDELPAFDAYPPGVETPIQASRPLEQPPSEGARGSCLCGDVRYVVEGTPIAARHCHCTRCQKARAAGFASNLVVPIEGLRFTAGEDGVRRYKVPEARYFTQCFCGNCGGKVPTVDTSRKIAVVPLGGLDDPPPIAPQEHIWTADVPAWSEILDDLPRFEGPPAD